jgi:cyclopropane fatty-acyl-phospholipid synthase-like methyltransferase
VSSRESRRVVMPQGTERILDERSLDADHAALAALLRPGMTVLDVGCGTGAITRGIADAVAPEGWVCGIDINDGLIVRAAADSAGQRNLRFEVAVRPGGTVTVLDYDHTRAEWEPVMPPLVA